VSEVFLSYAREDRAAAQALAEALQGLGLSVFWDDAIRTGHSFEDAIESAMTSAKAVVVLWSRHSVVSDWVRAEAAEGARRGILVPATLDGERPPLRYRIAQTANLVDWMAASGARSRAFETFLDDVAATVGGADAVPKNRGRSFAGNGDDAAFKNMKRSLKASTGFAWLGSAALAITFAYDSGMIRAAIPLWSVAYSLTFFALVCGAIASVALGVLSLRRQFVPGALQGLVWPVLAAGGQVVILVSAARLFRSLPFMSEMEALLAFLLCSTVGPGALTVGALIVSRSLNRKW
jgi:hypothetical protein